VPTLDEFSEIVPLPGRKGPLKYQSQVRPSNPDSPGPGPTRTAARPGRTIPVTPDTSVAQRVISVGNLVDR
jgi:hypothetical protein